MKIDQTYVEIAPTLSYTNWCVVVKVGRKTFPFVHLNRPKVISEESFNEAMEAIEIKLPDGFEFELAEFEPESPDKGKAQVKVAKK